MVKVGFGGGTACLGVKLLRLPDLVKGVAGQAVRHMNIMRGFSETDGLWQVLLLP